MKAPFAHRPLVIAHRGASGYRPEHTLESYRLAIELGADFIEPDLVSTKDGALVARHEPYITDTTDVAQHPQFADRKCTRVIDGLPYTGWFTVDFTLAELKTLRAVQPRPDRSKEFDGRFEIPTFDEIIALAREASEKIGRRVGIYPETKHPTWHCDRGLPLEDALLDALAKVGWTTRDAPVFLQSFEAGNLRWLRARTDVRLVQLLDGDGLTPEGRVKPARRWQGEGRCTRYPQGPTADTAVPHDFADPRSFAVIATYADAVGPWKRHLIGSRATDASDATERTRRVLPPTNFVSLAHAAGLAVHPWTFRNESQYLAADYGGDPRAEYAAFAALGVDAVFSDFPDTALAAFGR